uniref:Transmembrane protein n=1 Tax=Panagrellus redivivus TaxID=6233 RepID=A0A7E4VKC9_PANRE
MGVRASDQVATSQPVGPSSDETKKDVILLSTEAFCLFLVFVVRVPKESFPAVVTSLGRVSVFLYRYISNNLKALCYSHLHPQKILANNAADAIYRRTRLCKFWRRVPFWACAVFMP